MQHLCSTQNLTLTLGPNDHPSWWVDSSNVIHLEMRIHICIYMNLGKGVMYIVLCKQKLNTKISTEAELLAIDDAFGQILWIGLF